MHTRRIMLGLGLLAAATVARARLPRDQAPEQGPEASGQRREHLQTEDAGNRIDEERYGGETHSIHVQPKSGLPAYQVRPANSRDTSNREGGPGSAGRRTWKILDF